ncbi:UNVERIFIED_CONTAM: hypothetical protein NCL1_48447 [Trichonephila clavipes]
MQRDCALRIAGRGRFTSFSVEYKAGGVGTSGSETYHLHEYQAQGALTDQTSRKSLHRKKYTRTANCFIGRHPGNDSTFIRVLPVSSRTIRRRLTEGHFGSRHPLRVLPFTSIHRRLCLKCCQERGNWTTTEGNQVVFSDESRFNLSCDDNRVRV